MARVDWPTMRCIGAERRTRERNGSASEADPGGPVLHVSWGERLVAVAYSSGTFPVGCWWRIGAGVFVRRLHACKKGSTES